MKTLLLLLTILPTLTLAQSPETLESKVLSITPTPCETQEQTGCVTITLSTKAAGTPITLTMTPQDFLGGKTIGFREGDTVIVQSDTFEGSTVYFISDIVRRPALFWLAALFIIAVIAFGGIAAIRSLIGMILSFIVLFAVMLPLILQGWSPLLIAIAGGLVVMAVTFIVAHGWSDKMRAALIGTAISLLVTGILALLFSAFARLSGMDEETVFLLADYPDLNTRGILLAGIVIGSLGVLDDITISQASAVFELRGANPLLGIRELYVRAIRIGKDHISAAVNTLILAYAGSALPLLLLLMAGPSGESFMTMINREVIAVEIVRMLTGSIGLLAAVPVTTLIAAVLAMHTPPERGAHGHHHH